MKCSRMERNAGWNKKKICAIPGNDADCDSTTGQNIDNKMKAAWKTRIENSGKTSHHRQTTFWEAMKNGRLDTQKCTWSTWEKYRLIQYLNVEYDLYFVHIKGPKWYFAPSSTSDMVNTVWVVQRRLVSMFPGYTNEDSITKLHITSTACYSVKRSNLKMAMIRQFVTQCNATDNIKGVGPVLVIFSLKKYMHECQNNSTFTDELSSWNVTDILFDYLFGHWWGSSWEQNDSTSRRKIMHIVWSHWWLSNAYR